MNSLSLTIVRCVMAMIGCFKMSPFPNAAIYTNISRFKSCQVTLITNVIGFLTLIYIHLLCSLQISELIILLIIFVYQYATSHVTLPVSWKVFLLLFLNGLLFRYL